MGKTDNTNNHKHRYQTFVDGFHLKVEASSGPYIMYIYINDFIH